MHDGRTRLVVLVLRDPHLLEGGQRRQDGTTDPHGVLTLRRSDDLDLHGARSQSGQLLGHTLTNAREHGGTTGQHNVGVQILTDIDVALHDGLEGGIVDTGRFAADEERLEQDFRAAEALVADGDDVT